jgi:hypothetical protein
MAVIGQCGAKLVPQGIILQKAQQEEAKGRERVIWYLSHIKKGRFRKGSDPRHLQLGSWCFGMPEA